MATDDGAAKFRFEGPRKKTGGIVVVRGQMATDQPVLDQPPVIESAHEWIAQRGDGTARKQLSMEHRNGSDVVRIMGIDDAERDFVGHCTRGVGVCIH